MSRFFSEKYKNLTPYTPGEQPQEGGFVKLNTNESPFPPSPKAAAALSSAEINKLRLYPDPESRLIRRALAANLSLDIENIFVGNGSDEVLAFIFAAFFDGEREVCFPEISYGFYPVYCELYGIKTNTIPLKEDYSIDIEAFVRTDKSVVLANPNSPTGMAVPGADIEKLLKKRERLVIVDEAYIDFGGESAVELVKSYDNLIVVQTLSKSRSLAGGRLGYAVACPELIADLFNIKYSFNSYNVNRLTEIVAAAAVEDKDYFEYTRREIIKNRERTVKWLESRGFDVLPSAANFIFTKSGQINGAALYQRLRAKGILVRHFNKPRLSDFVRISIGSDSDTDKLLKALGEIISTIEDDL
ncbi:MAG TPA: histidinol-phosphate transaminase [Eubacteriales bacterium]|jgi:histidinol-phosphate aminotransferase|nr:histidinol-phosphate transaminase [Clostridia bacterium]HRR89176.1 histidinol-phosphate transaminase [Eubacteriales bacterium]HRU83812.1 histidinol-phosphate transaminase [Eubacteriales bacterium]